jgi:hypothetical protein
MIETWSDYVEMIVTWSNYAEVIETWSDHVEMIETWSDYAEVIETWSDYAEVIETWSDFIDSKSVSANRGTNAYDEHHNIRWSLVSSKYNFILDSKLEFLLFFIILTTTVYTGITQK